MNSIHDMGGMHGFGAVEPTDDTLFRYDWEIRFHALMRVLGVHDIFTIDERRSLRE